MSNYIIPSICLLVIIYGLYKNINIYDSFIQGVKEGLNLVFDIFPVIFSFSICVNVLIKSNILISFSSFVCSILGINNFSYEIVLLSLMRPVSGSSSLIILNDMFRLYGPDSYIGRVASLIQGSTDTTIYIIGLYFSSVGIKRIRYAMLVGLLSDLVAIVLSFLVISILF